MTNPNLMMTSLTTLAKNIFVADKISQRALFASKIIEIVKKIAHNSQKDVEVFLNLEAVIDKCVVNPEDEARVEFFKIVRQYDQILISKGFNAAA